MLCDVRGDVRGVRVDTGIETHIRKTSDDNKGIIGRPTKEQSRAGQGRTEMGRVLMSSCAKCSCTMQLYLYLDMNLDKKLYMEPMTGSPRHARTLNNCDKGWSGKQS